jgi:hypothetical protein
MTYQEWVAQFSAGLNPHTPLQECDLRSAWNAAIEAAMEQARRGMD